MAAGTELGRVDDTQRAGGQSYCLVASPPSLNLGPFLQNTDFAREDVNDPILGPSTVGSFGLLYYIHCDLLNKGPQKMLTP